MNCIDRCQASNMTTRQNLFGKAIGLTDRTARYHTDRALEKLVDALLRRADGAELRTAELDHYLIVEWDTGAGRVGVPIVPSSEPALELVKEIHVRSQETIGWYDAERRLTEQKRYLPRGYRSRRKTLGHVAVLPRSGDCSHSGV